MAPTVREYSTGMTVVRDTAAAARRVQIEALRRLDGPTRLQMALRMSDDSRQVTLAGIRHRHPEWTDDDVHRELLRLLLGRELAASAVAHRRRTDR
jgi:Flp pilus assembly protein CpaB